jgi:hypothetical protein
MPKPKPRVLTLADVRVTQFGKVTTAPAWAYRPGPDRDPEPDPAAWAPLLAELGRLYGPGGRRAYWLLGELKCPGYTPSPLPVPGGTATRACCICGQPFYHFNSGPGRYCSRRCNYRRPRPPDRESRAKDPESRTRDCQRCGQPFTPARADALYCSARCRVAAHRLGRRLAGPLDPGIT